MTLVSITGWEKYVLATTENCIDGNYSDYNYSNNIISIRAAGTSSYRCMANTNVNLSCCDKIYFTTDSTGLSTSDLFRIVFKKSGSRYTYSHNLSQDYEVDIPEWAQTTGVTIIFGYSGHNGDVGYIYNIAKNQSYYVSDPDFTADIVEADLDEIITFTPSSISGCPSPSVLWDFGDGQTSSETNPTHAYDVSGNKTVSLTIYNGYSTKTETKTDYISVNSPPTSVKLNANPKIVVTGGESTLSAIVSGGFPIDYTYSWYVKESGGEWSNTPTVDSWDDYSGADSNLFQTLIFSVYFFSLESITVYFGDSIPEGAKFGDMLVNIGSPYYTYVYDGTSLHEHPYSSLFAFYCKRAYDDGYTSITLYMDIFDVPTSPTKWDVLMINFSVISSPTYNIMYYDGSVWSYDFVPPITDTPLDIYCEICYIFMYSAIPSFSTPYKVRCNAGLPYTGLGDITIIGGENNLVSIGTGDGYISTDSDAVYALLNEYMPTPVKDNPNYSKFYGATEVPPDIEYGTIYYNTTEYLDCTHSVANIGSWEFVDSNNTSESPTIKLKKQTYFSIKVTVSNSYGGITESTDDIIECIYLTGPSANSIKLDIVIVSDGFNPLSRV